MLKGLKKAAALCAAIAYMFSALAVSPLQAAGSRAQGGDGLMEDWVLKGIVDRKSDIYLKSGEAISRVEFYILINRIFGYTEKTAIHFSDVLENTWYGDEIAKAVAAGYLQDEVKGRAAPFTPINRAEAAVVLVKVFNLQAASEPFVYEYPDEDKIPQTARAAVHALNEKGFANELPDGRFAPWNSMSRMDAVIWIHSMTGGIINKKGTYREPASGSLVVNTTGVTLRGMSVKGDLYLTEGIGDGHVTLDGVDIRGRVIVRGGGEDSIVIRNSTVKGGLLVAKKDGRVRITAEGRAEFGNVELQSGAVLEEKKITGKGFEGVRILELPAAGHEIRLAGSFTGVSVEAPGAQVVVDGSLNKLAAGKTADEAGIRLVKGSIGELDIYGNKSYIRLAGGKVEKLTVLETAAATRIEAGGAAIGILDAKAGISADIQTGTVERLDIGSKAEGSHVRVGSGAVVKHISAYAGMSVKGYGRIESAAIYANNVVMEPKPLYVYVASGIAANIGGGTSLPDEKTLAVTVGDYEVREGETRAITASVFPPEASDAALVFSSADTDIATVDSVNKTITGVRMGTATMHVTAGKSGYKTGTGSFRVKVTSRYVTAAGSLAVSPSSGAAGAVGTLALTYTLGDRLENGNVIFTLPQGFSASAANDEVIVRGAASKLTAGQISGQKVTLFGITAQAAGEKVVLVLKDKKVPAAGTYEFIAAADADGDGERPASPGTGSETAVFTSNAVKLLTEKKGAGDGNYSAPEPGTAEGTTRIRELVLNNVAAASKWQILVKDGAFDAPALDSVIQDAADYTADDGIPIKANQHLVLLAVDSQNRVKGYADIIITAGQIKPYNAVPLGKGVHYTALEPGSAGGTTRVAGLDFGEIKADKWMIRVQPWSDSPGIPVKGSIVQGAADYGTGADIEIGAGQCLLLLAAAGDGRVEGYAHIKAGTENIARAARELKDTDNCYHIPGKGAEGGTTTITALDLSNIDGAVKWQIVVQDGSFGKPVMDSTVSSITIDDYASPLTDKNIPISAGRHLILLATDAGGKIKAYRDFTITAGQIRPYDAVEIPAGNYSSPIPGSAPGTTKLAMAGLKFDGIEGAAKWRVKIQDTEFAVPYKDTDFSGVPVYGGENIAAKALQHLILIATDDAGRVKAYADITLQDSQIKPPAAVPLAAVTHYSLPTLGSAAGKTKITSLSMEGLPAGVSKWCYKIQDGEFEIPSVNGTLEETVAYTAGDDIPKDPMKITVGQHLLLLATDESGAIKAYADLTVSADQIKAPPAVPLVLNTNYKLPVAGTAWGTTQVPSLDLIGIVGATKWMYRVQADEIAGIPMDSILNGALSLTKDTNIPITAGQHLILLATDSGGRIKAYADLAVTPEQIKAPAAGRLQLKTNYSLPEEGLDAGKTRIRSLSLAGYEDTAAKWMYKVLSDSDTFAIPSVNSTLDGAADYTPGDDIAIKAGQHLILLATDNDGKIQAYADLVVTADQIKAPLAPELKNTPPTVNYTEPQQGSAGGTTKISTLDLIGVPEAAQWLYKVQTAEFSKPSYNSTIQGAALYSAGTNIPIAAGQYLLLLAADGYGRVKAYKIFQVSAGQIKAPAARELTLNTNYSLPVPGLNEGKTRIMALSPAGLPAGTYTWYCKIGDGAFSAPAMDSILADTFAGAEEYTATEDIPGIGMTISAGQHLLLLAENGEGKIKAYVDLTIAASQIKAPNAPKLSSEDPANFTLPEPGSAWGTAKISALNLIGVVGATQWRVKVQAGQFDIPSLNSTVTGAADYTAGSDIPISGGQHLLLLATDDYGRVKGYIDMTVSALQIKPQAAPVLVANTNYSLPEPGSQEGRMKIALLSLAGFSPAATKWQYKVQDGALEVPAINSTLGGAGVYTANTDIQITAGQHLILLAVNDGNEIKAYADFVITAGQIRAPDALLLSPTPPEANYSVPEPGSAGGTTKISALSPIGIVGAARWQTAVRGNSLNGVAPALNSRMQDAVFYTAGADIPVNAGQYLILLATDEYGNIKGYAEIAVDSKCIRSSAALLVKGTDYEDPVPGFAVGTAKVKLLRAASDITGAMKWMYKVQPGSFGTILKDSVMEGAQDYISEADIPAAAGWRLILLATDNSGKIKAYKEFELQESQISKIEAAISGTILAAGNLPVETDIATGGRTVAITLTHGTWVSDVAGSQAGRNQLFDGFMAGSEATEWAKVTAALKADGAGAIARVSDTTVIITLPETPAYNIAGSQTITLTIPAGLITGASANVKAEPSFTIAAAVGAAVTGTITGSPCGEADIASGGKTMIITLSSGQWVSGIASLEANRNALFDGLKAETGDDQWPKVVDALKAAGSGAITRNSGTKVTVTLPKVDGYDIPANRTITLIIPRELITGAVADVTALPAIRIYASIVAELSGTVLEAGLNETHIAGGGRKVEITLAGGVWAPDVDTDAAKRNALFGGFTPATEATEWARVVNALKTDGQMAIARNSDTKVTIILPTVENYNISANQEVALTIPASAVAGAVVPVTASPAIRIAAVQTAAITGTAVSQPPAETGIASGGKTLIVTLSNCQWAADIATSDTKRDALFDGLKADGSEQTVWNEKVVARLKAVGASAIARNSNYQVTITLPAAPGYDIESDQTITLTIPEIALIGASAAITASPSFRVTSAPPLPVAVVSVVSTADSGTYSVGQKLPINIVFSGEADVDLSGGVPVLQLETGSIDRDAVYTGGTGTNTLAFEYTVQPGDAASRLDYKATGSLVLKGAAIRNKGTSVNAVLTLPGPGSLYSIGGTKTIVIDTAAPVYASGYPKPGTLTETSADIKVKVNEGGKAYLIVLPAGSPAPSAAQVRNGKDAAGEETAIKGSAGLTANIEGVLQAAGLTVGMSYDIYTVCEDSAGNLQPAPFKLTAVMPDLTAPEFASGYPHAAMVSDTAVEIAVMSNEAGKAYFVAVPNEAPAPSAVQVKAGKNGSGVLVASNMKGSTVLTANTEGSIDISGLTVSTSYDIYVVCEDETSNLQALPVKLDVTTNALFGVGIDIAAGYLTKTTTAMQYSLDYNETAKTGTWYNCKSSTTAVEFTGGQKIYVRIAAQPSETRHLLDIAAPGAAPQTTGISYDAGAGIMTGTADDMQYKTGESGWNHVKAGGTTGGITFEPGEVLIRCRATATALPSEAASLGVIAQPDPAPELNYDDVANTITKPDGSKIDGAYEYSVDAGPWFQGDVAGDFSGIHTVLVRKRATSKALPSQSKEMVFTANTPSVIAYNSGKNLGLGAGDKVVITFEEDTDKPEILAADLDGYLKLTGSGGSVHSWGTGLADPDIVWNAAGNKLTITFSSIEGTTIAIGDTVTVGEAAGKPVIRTGAGKPLSDKAVSGTVKGAFTSPPAITKVEMANGGAAGVLDPGDRVIITFDQRTNKPVIRATDLNAWLKLGNKHTWGENLAAGNLTVLWNAAGDELAVTFVQVKNATVAAGDAIAISAAAGIKDADGTTAATTAVSKAGTGSF